MVDYASARSRAPCQLDRSDGQPSVIDSTMASRLISPIGGVERPCRVVRFARLIHRRVRALGRPAAGAACGGNSDPALLATQSDQVNVDVTRRMLLNQRLSAGASMSEDDFDDLGIRSQEPLPVRLTTTLNMVLNALVLNPVMASVWGATLVIVLALLITGRARSVVPSLPLDILIVALAILFYFFPSAA